MPFYRSFQKTHRLVKQSPATAKNGATSKSQMSRKQTYLNIKISNINTIILCFFCLLSAVSYSQSAEDYFHRGVAKIEKQDFSGAISDFTKSIQKDASVSVVFFNRGLAKLKNEEYSGAIDDFTKAIQLKPKAGESYSTRGNAKLYMKNYSGALKDYQIAIRLDPKDDLAFSNRAKTKLALKDYSGAIADYTEAIKLNSKNSQSL